MLHHDNVSLSHISCDRSMSIKNFPLLRTSRARSIEFSHRHKALPSSTANAHFTPFFQTISLAVFVRAAQLYPRLTLWGCKLSDLHNYDVSTENLVTFLLVYFPLHLVGWESDRLVIFARLHFNWNLSRVREREICVWATHFTCHKYLSRDDCGDTFDQHPTVIAWIVDAAVKLIVTFVQHVNFLCDR